MKITKRQLRRIIRESIMEVAVPGPEGYDTYDEYKASFDANMPAIDPKDVPPRPKSKDNILYVTRSPHGWFAETDDGSGVSTGDMVLTLLAKNLDEAIFQGSNEANANFDDRLALIQKHQAGVQGGMQNWDNSVFEDYYNVHLETVLQYYAKDQGFKIQETNE